MSSWVGISLLTKAAPGAVHGLASGMWLARTWPLIALNELPNSVVGRLLRVSGGFGYYSGADRRSRAGSCISRTRWRLTGSRIITTYPDGTISLHSDNLCLYSSIQDVANVSHPGMMQPRALDLYRTPGTTFPWNIFYILFGYLFWKLISDHPGRRYWGHVIENVCAGCGLIMQGSSSP